MHTRAHPGLFQPVSLHVRLEFYVEVSLDPRQSRKLRSLQKPSEALSVLGIKCTFPVTWGSSHFRQTLPSILLLPEGHFGITPALPSPS